MLHNITVVTLNYYIPDGVKMQEELQLISLYLILGYYYRQQSLGGEKNE